MSKHQAARTQVFPDFLSLPLFPDDDEKHGWGTSDVGGGGGGRSGGGGGGDTNPDRPTPGTGMLT